MVKNIQSLRRHRAQISAACETAVLEAIARLEKEPGKVTITGVAREAEVSTSFIYTHPHIEQKVRRLINLRKRQPTKNQIQQQRIEELQQELIRAKSDYRKIDTHQELVNTTSANNNVRILIQEVERLNQHNIWLTNELNECKRKLLDNTNPQYL